MKKIFLLCAAFILLASLVDAREVTFKWGPNPENNGTEAGYKIYNMADLNNPVDVGNVTIYKMNITNDPQCFSATAYNADGVESGMSQKACIDIPEAPLGLTITIIITIDGIN